jgi:hypothetical protein
LVKTKYVKTLDEKTFEWIEKTEKAKRESTPGRPSTNAERQRYLHIRRVAIKELEDLARLAECLPEDQLNQIFNTEILESQKNPLTRLFMAILNLKGLDYNKDREIVKAKRHRLLPICYELVTLLNDRFFVGMLVEPIVSNLMVKEGGWFWGIKAVYYRSMVAGAEEGRLFDK